MVTTSSLRNGSALLLCIVVMMSITTLFSMMHMRMHFFMKTIYEREQYVQLRAGAQAVMAYALEKGCLEWNALITTEHHESCDLPLDGGRTMQVLITYRQLEDAYGRQLVVQVKAMCDQRAYTVQCHVQPEYDSMSGELRHYAVRSWCMQ